MRVILVLVCFFGGSLGLHRFLAKQFKTGFLYLLLVGIFVFSDFSTSPKATTYALSDLSIVLWLLLWVFDLFCIIFLGRFLVIERPKSVSDVMETTKEETKTSFPKEPKKSLHLAEHEPQSLGESKSPKVKNKTVDLLFSGGALGLIAARLSTRDLKDLGVKAQSSGADFLKNHLQLSEKFNQTRFPYTVGFKLEELNLSLTQTDETVDITLCVENEAAKLTEIEDDEKIIEFIGVTNGFSKFKSSFEIPENESFDASKLELKILSVNLYGYVGLKSKILTGVEYMGQLHNFDLEIQDEALERYLLVYDEDCDVILDEKAGEFDRAALFDFE